MKALRTYLRPALAFLLALSSIPAWACASTCGTTPKAGLACVRLCAHSKALLTQGGKLDSIGAMACGVQAQDKGDNGVLASAPALQSPDLVFVGIATVPSLGLPQASIAQASTRGPPQASRYLSFQHPTANGPPSFV